MGEETSETMRTRSKTFTCEARDFNVTYLFNTEPGLLSYSTQQLIPEGQTLA